LRKIEYGDHDYIITFLTRSQGKIAVIAKNAKKSVKRFSGALDLFSVNHIHCTYPKRNKAGLTILAHTDLSRPFANIRYSVLKTAYASYWVELIYLWLEEGKGQPELYDLLFFSLKMLDDSDILTQVISILFQIRFMSISGFTPSMACCENCGTRVDQIRGNGIRFDFQEGRVVCPDCLSRGSGHFMKVSKGTLKQLFWINTTDMDRAERIRFSPLSIQEGAQLLESFIPFHIGRKFKTLSFLKRLRQEAP
jgi:DNA repair protein RecO (recombination protein O)